MTTKTSKNEKSGSAQTPRFQEIGGKVKSSLPTSVKTPPPPKK